MMLSAQGTLSQPKLGRQVYDAINTNHLEKVKSLMPTLREMEVTVDNLQLTKKEKEELLESHSKRIETHGAETMLRIVEGFKEIRTDFESSHCADKPTLGDITSKTLKLKDGLEIAHIRINYACGANLKTIKFSSIKTDFGWRVLGDLELIDKEL